MKECPKCSIEHNKPGKFCSRSCANSRGPRTEDFKARVSAKLKGHEAANYNRRPIDCLNCSTTVYVNQKSTRKFCSKKCYLEFVAISADAMDRYRKQCTFTFDVNNYPEEFDLALLAEHGWYQPANKGNNLTGVSRDHIFSVRDGFINNVPPDVISHPANCRLMLHNDNNRKNAVSDICLEELHQRIERWEKHVVVTEMVM
jgi:hypothetical protein